MVELERHDGVATVTLNRPQALNAMTLELKDALIATIAELHVDDAVRAVVLTGAGRGFCVGQDLKELAGDLDRRGNLEDTVTRHFNPIVLGLAALPKPVIAAVNGPAAGAGAGVAMACDFRIASTSASFLLAFANVGLTLDSGVSWLLPRLIGRARATALALLAEPVSAEAALEMGLVNAVVEPGHLLTAAMELATRLAKGPTAAYAAIKASIAFGADSSLADSLAEEARLQRVMNQTGDHLNAVAAFLAKQPAVFVGR